MKYTIEKKLRHHVVEWSAAILSLIGTIYNTLQRIEGFYIWMVANVLWIAFAFKHRHWGLLVMNIIFFVLNIVALFVWRV